MDVRPLVPRHLHYVPPLGVAHNGTVTAIHKERKREGERGGARGGEREEGRGKEGKGNMHMEREGREARRRERDNGHNGHDRRADRKTGRRRNIYNLNVLEWVEWNGYDSIGMDRVGFDCIE